MLAIVSSHLAWVILQSSSVLAGVIGDVHVAGFNRLGNHRDFLAQLLHSGQRIGVGRNHPGGDVFGITGIHVQHEQKLREELYAVAVGEAVINLPRQLPLFSGIGGEHFFK